MKKAKNIVIYFGGGTMTGAFGAGVASALQEGWRLFFEFQLLLLNTNYHSTIASEEDNRIRRALSVAQKIEFYTYSIKFSLKKIL